MIPLDIQISDRFPPRSPSWSLLLPRSPRRSPSLLPGGDDPFDRPRPQRFMATRSAEPLLVDTYAIPIPILLSRRIRAIAISHTTPLLPPQSCLGEIRRRIPRSDHRHGQSNQGSRHRATHRSGGERLYQGARGEQSVRILLYHQIQ